MQLFEQVNIHEWQCYTMALSLITLMADHSAAEGPECDVSFRPSTLMSPLWLNFVYIA